MAEWRLFTEKDYDYSGISKLFDSTDRGESLVERNAARIPAEPNEIQQGIRQLQYRVTKHERRTRFEHRGKSGLVSKIPRAHVWRSYRFSQGPALLGIVSIKASEAFNLTEVDVFLSVQIPQLPSTEVTRQMLLFIFTDAVRCGTSLAVRMTDKCNNGKIPRAIHQLADQHGVVLSHANSGAISPEESRELYLKLCNFSAEAESKIRSLYTAGTVSPERICYLTCAGIWTKIETEFLLANAPQPELLLGKNPETVGGLRYSQAMYSARSALIADTIYRVATRSEVLFESAHESVEERGGAELDIEFGFSRLATGNLHHAVTLCSRQKELRFPGWSASSSDVVLPKGATLIVAIRPYEIDLLTTSKLRKETTSGASDAIICLAVSYDFKTLSKTRQAELISAVGSPSRMLVCPDLCCRLNSEADRKISRGEYVRS
jgi:hypothetical protein